MNTTRRRFTLSCPEFGGFTTTVAVNNAETLQGIANAVVAKLRRKLAGLGLETLCAKLDEIKPSYHIHDFSVENIITRDQLYYVCNHGCGPENQ
jgi:hypothetical protein